MRLKSEIWVKAYLRRCTVNGAMAVVARHGDDDAGAIFIRVIAGDGSVQVFAPAPAGVDGADFDRRFVIAAGAPFATEQDAELFLDKQRRFDSDLWIVDVEDRAGRHFLDDTLMQ